MNWSLMEPLEDFNPKLLFQVGQQPVVVLMDRGWGECENGVWWNLSEGPEVSIRRFIAWAHYTSKCTGADLITGIKLKALHMLDMFYTSQTHNIRR